MSFATINSICDVYNKMTFVEYLQLTHQWMINPDKFNEDKKQITIITLCTSHLMKNLSRDIKSFFADSVHAKIIIEIFSSFFNINSFAAIKDVWRKLCFILKSKFTTTDTEKTMNYLILQITSLFKVVEEKDDENTQDDQTDEASTRKERTANFYQKNKTIYESSPCYKDFFEIYMETTVDENNDGKINPFYSPDLVTCLLKKYVTYLGLFCGVLNHDGRRNSNSFIECYFSKIKRNIAKERIVTGDRRLRVTEFLSLLLRNIQYVHKLYIFKIPTSRICSKTKIRSSRTPKRKLPSPSTDDSQSAKKIKMDMENVTAIDSLKSKETWRKKEKTMSGYFLMNNSKKFLQKRVAKLNVPSEIPTKLESGIFFTNGNFKNPQVYAVSSGDCDLYLCAKSDVNCKIEDFKELNDKKMLSNPI